MGFADLGTGQTATVVALPIDALAIHKKSPGRSVVGQHGQPQGQLINTALPDDLERVETRAPRASRNRKAGEMRVSSPALRKPPHCIFAGNPTHLRKADTMSNLRYWSFPVADAKAAVMMTTGSHTEVALVDLTALPHFLEQLDRIRPQPQPTAGEEKPAVRRAAAKAARKRPI